MRMPLILIHFFVFELEVAADTRFLRPVFRILIRLATFVSHLVLLEIGIPTCLEREPPLSERNRP